MSTTVGQLRAAIAGLSDDTPILIEETGLGYVGLLEDVQGPIDNGNGPHLVLIGEGS